VLGVQVNPASFPGREYQAKLPSLTYPALTRVLYMKMHWNVPLSDERIQKFSWGLTPTQTP